MISRRELFKSTAILAAGSWLPETKEAITAFPILTNNGLHEFVYQTHMTNFTYFTERLSNETIWALTQ